MSDENTSDSPTSNTADSPPELAAAAPSTTAEAIGNSSAVLPQEPVEATPSATTNVKENIASDLPQTTDQTAPSSQIGASIHKECRSAPRIHVGWHADALIDGHDVYHGFIKDISLKGADIFFEHNLQDVKFIKLHIYVPPLDIKITPHAVDVSGKIIYTTYDGNESLFHTGISFLKFNLESDLEYLQSRIANY